MNDKRNEKKLGARIAGFFGGGGFYIALFLCVALVGVYAWAVLFEGGFRRPGTTDPAEPANQEAAVSVGSFGTSYILSGDYDTPAPGGHWEPRQGSDPVEQSDVRPASAGLEADSAPVASFSQWPDYFQWPLSGELLRGYSIQALSYDRTMSDWRVHAAMDISAQMGAKVHAAADGQVESIRHDPLLGTVVVIAHGGGLTSIYGNLGEQPTVSEGQRVTAGTVIGCISDSALGEIAEPSHLHFAMEQDGMPVDPVDWLPEK